MGVYIFAIVAALAVAADGQIWLAESLLFLGIYLGYIALVLLLPRLRTMFPALFGGRRVAVASGNVNGSALLPAAGIGGDPGLVVPPYSDRAFLSDPALSKPNGLSDAEAATATMLAAADDDDDEAEEAEEAENDGPAKPKLSAKKLAAMGFVAKVDGKKKPAGKGKGKKPAAKKK